MNYQGRLTRDIKQLEEQNKTLQAELSAFKKNNEELIQRHNAAIASWDEERERALREAARVKEWREKYEDNIDLTKNMKTTQEKIDDIMDYFDFAKVAKAMEALNWTWKGEDVPTEPELRKEARRLLNSVSNKNVCKCDFKYSISTGGFQATKYHYDELELEFILTHWSTDYNN